MTRRAVVLLSGGLDSATVAAVARRDGYEVHALSVRYGQRHSLELDAARQVAASIGAAEHLFVDVDLRAIGGSALTTDMPLAVDGAGVGHGREIPATYVPARNTLLLALALARAEVLGTFDIFVGVNAVDYSGYPDCRPEFLSAFERLADLATRAGVEEGGRFRIHAPLLRLAKREIIALGLELGVDYSPTVSCYDAAPGGGCGRCDACLIRLRGFDELGLTDPAPYRAGAAG